MKTETKSPEATSRERFVRDTANHEMTVLHDDGIYRHLRFMAPDRSEYWFDLITWPGRLVVCGDVGDYMFSRITDMFEFFGGRGSNRGFESVEYGINAYYWGEKLRGASNGREQAKHYSEDVYKAAVEQWYSEVAEDLDEAERASLRGAVDEELLEDDSSELSDEGCARLRLRDFDHDGHDLSESWEWDLREWDSSYLWSLWAIVWGIEKYRSVAARDSRLPEEGDHA